MSEPTAEDLARAREIRLAIEDSGRYGPDQTMDPHDGSVQRKVELILAAAIAEARGVNAKALADLVAILPVGVGCIHFHHKPSDRHDFGQPCPIVERYRIIVEAARDAGERGEA